MNNKLRNTTEGKGKYLPITEAGGGGRAASGNKSARLIPFNSFHFDVSLCGVSLQS